MPLDEDKYPAESGRRRFVKGVVGSAALSTGGGGTLAALDVTTGPLGSGGGRTNYFGIANTAGPAPRGMPILPLELEDGQLKGQVPSTQESLSDSDRQDGFNGSGVPYTWSWFQYCGIQSYQGLNPDYDSENFIRATSSSYNWMSDVDPGTILRKDMFQDYKEWGNEYGEAGIGKPADARWRSEAENATTIPVQVLRSRHIKDMANQEGRFSDLDDNMAAFIEAATVDGFIAWINKCTHFCCVPGFKTSDYQTADNKVYCQCHQSIYDPFKPVQKDFIAAPRPD